MKIPKARKLKSGSWNVQVQIQGELVSITRDSEKKCIAEAARLKAEGNKVKKKTVLTVTEAIDRYIEKRTSSLSPSTVRGYRKVQSLRFQPLMNRKLSGITQEQWQKAVDKEAEHLAPKTVTNSWRFMASVIKEFTGKKFDIHLPAPVVVERPWLTHEQIKTFVALIKGNPFEIPALLALCSLRRSEIMALQWENVDLENSAVRVAGAVVTDEHERLVRKDTNKNKTSARIVPIMPQLREALARVPEKKGRVVTCYPPSINRAVNKLCRENGLPEVGVHGLRHSFASLAYHLNIPEKVAMQIGGWSNSKTMHDIYTHVAQQDIQTQVRAVTDFYNSCTESLHEAEKP